jgi:hypothetical protein
MFVATYLNGWHFEGQFWSMQEGISNISHFAMAVKLVTLFWLWKSSLGKQLIGYGLVLLYYALCIFLVGTEELISWRTR